MKERIFISYRRNASKWAAAYLYKLLRNEYLRNVFLDIADIKGEWESGLTEAVKNAKYFVLFLSHGSFKDLKKESKFLEEMHNALKYKRFIVPILQDETEFKAFDEYLKIHGLENLKKYQAISLIYQFNSMEHCAERVNRFTTPDRDDIPEIEVDLDVVRNSLNELQEGPYKEAVKEYYRDTYCEICTPENPFANFIDWTGHGASIEKGEEYVEYSGRCNFCNAIQIKCAKCGSVTSLFSDANGQDCDGHCGIKFNVVFNAREGEDILTVYNIE